LADPFLDWRLLKIVGSFDRQVTDSFSGALQDAAGIREMGTLVEAQIDVLGVHGDMTDIVLQSARGPISKRHGVVSIPDGFVAGSQFFEHPGAKVQG
jgi:hypothetical protein